MAVLLAPIALAASVLGARQGPPASVNPLAADAAAVSDGRDLYNQICQSCHGTSGQGGDRGPSLSTGTFSHGNTDGDLFRSIRNGIPGTQMAGFPA
jgi:mono/diheme cytochrome c family protein